MTDTQITVSDAVDAAQEKFQKIAPRGIDFTAERSFAVQLLHNNDYLKRAAQENPLSLQAAIINVAAIGLSLNPAKKQAYLIPRNVKHGDRWITKVFLEPSYMGLVDIATMSGSIKWVQACLVHANDTYIDNGPGEKPAHTYEAFKPRGDVVGVYCVAKTADGDFLTATMAIDEVHAVRDRSESWKRNKSGPWATDFGEQAKKTVIRRAFKTWPKTETLDRMAAAVQISNDNEGFEPILSSPPLGQYTAEQKGYFDQLITKSDALGMFLFVQSIDETTFTNLYHSFEKGQKGKYQNIIDKLNQEGAALMRDIVDTINEHALSGNDLGVRENIETASDAEKAYILDHVCDEAAAIIRGM